MANERLGAIDRIDKPQVVCILLRLPGFFAVKTVLGKLPENNLTDSLFTFDVCLGHGGPVGLCRYREISIVILATDLSSSSGCFERNAQKFRFGGRIHGAQLWPVNTEETS